MTAPATPLPCPLCASEFRFNLESGLKLAQKHEAWRHPINGCLLGNFRVWARDIAAWNRRVPPPGQAALVEADEQTIQRVAVAICEARGQDPHELTYHHNGEILEPYGDAWTRYIPEARAALSAVADGDAAGVGL